MKRDLRYTIKILTLGLAICLAVFVGCGRSKDSRSLQPAPPAPAPGPSTTPNQPGQPAPPAGQPAQTPATAPTAANSQAPSYPIKEAALVQSQKPFNHQDHKLDCAVCHDRAAEANPKCSKTDSKDVAVRDSSENYTPCFPAHDACIKCHQNEFLPSRISTPEGQAWCVRCHKNTSSPVTFVKFTKVQSEYGVRGRSDTLRGFSHKDHMDASKMTDNPELAKCSTCHKTISGGISYTMPGHAECYQCHTHQAAAASQQPKAQCATCHANKVDETPLRFSRKVEAAFTVYNFNHSKHIGKAACERCHQQIDSPAVAKSDILLISTAAGQRHTSKCWTCHKLSGTREQNCNYCHLGGQRPFRSRVGARINALLESTEF